MTHWGFLGTGRVTRRMIDAVRAAGGATLSGIASRDFSRASAWAAERNAEANRNENEQVEAYLDYASLLSEPSIDWVYVALPPSLHHRWTLAALAAGKHVLCEKPLCLHWREANELASAARRSGRRLYHATAYPYHPRSAAAKNIIRSGELGEIRRVTVACSFAGILNRGEDHRIDRSLGGGCLLDLGWYCVHSTLWFTGLDCVKLQAIGSKHGGVWHQVQVIAELSNGAVAHWDCGFDAAPRRWIEIAGSDASWICDDFLRPIDMTKPRFWIHGQQGMSRAEIVGENVLQEALMMEACQNGDSNDEQLELAIKTQSVLDDIERAIERD